MSLSFMKNPGYKWGQLRFPAKTLLKFWFFYGRVYTQENFDGG